ncbi:MAG: response regulator [Bacteroidaceae bacterium]|nr:response regulator [Bacteroidaceae bacterium]
MSSNLIARLKISALVALTALTVQAAPYGFRSYMTANGLSDNRVLCALQDSYGFMWIGTANGLNCFDGQNNTVYRNMVSYGSAFENNLITSLFEHEGNIWLGGDFGLYVYSRADNSFARFDVQTRYGVPISCTVSKMERTQNGLIWICTQGQGLFLYDTATSILKQDSRHNGFISDLTIGTDGLVYLVSLDGQLLVYNQDGHFQHQYEVPGFVVDKSDMCVENVGSRIFVGSNKGLFSLNVERQELDPVPLGGGVSYVRSLMARDTELLLGTDHGLFVYRLDDGSLSRLDDPLSVVAALSDDCVNGLLASDDGTLWILTERGGVNMQPAIPQGLDILSIPANAHSLRNRILSVCSTHDGRIWAGTESGLYVCDPGTAAFHQPQAMTSKLKEVCALLEDGDDLWIGTRNDGLYVLDMSRETLRHYTYSADHPYTIASNEVTSLLRSSAGNIYVGTSWGLRLYDRAQDHFMFFSEISSMTGITDMMEDREGGIWVATDGHGLLVKRKGASAFAAYQALIDDARSLPNNTVTSVACDSRGTVWVATKGGGLCSYVPQSDGFERFGSPDTPLQREQIYFIQDDGEGSLWLGTENGFARVNPDGGVQLDIIHFDSHAQSPWNVCCRTADGRIFASVAGELVSLDPRRFAVTAVARPIYIRSISFPNTENSQAELERLGLNHPLYICDAIRLPYTDNHFTLHFASPRFSGLTLVNYEYMMDGFDHTWARGSVGYEATYSNLPSGNYTFLLREAGINDPQRYARLRIIVLPPWYRTPWAYVVYAIGLAALAFLLFKWLQRRVQRTYEARMEEYKLRQEKDTFQSKIDFFINLVHEIRTPLSLINLPLEQMEESDLSDDDRIHLHAIRRNTNYLLGITNQLLDFQKAESDGSIKLQMRTCDVGALLDGIYRQFKDPMKVQGLSLQLQLPEAPVLTSIDGDKVSKVLMNLLGNALKYARSEVILRLDQPDDERFVISVIDDGPGVPEEERDRIFDVYYQIAGDATAAHLGTGLGLSYAKMLSTAHGGDISYSDAVGGGSNFTLTLPLRTDETAADELKEPESAVANDSEDAKNADSIDSKRSFRILLVEDNDELLRATADGLRKWFHVMKAHDGVEALDLLKHHDMDVIVSDVMMPRMDGNELCRQLKSDIRYSHLPVILLTAKTTVEAKLEGMQSGADIYLEKPFSMKQLHLQITSLLRMRQRFYERMRQVDGAEAAVGGDADFGLNQQDIQFMERLQELVRRNMRDEEFSIDVLAEQMNMSRSSFYRKIKALTDMTPVDYMKTQRLERAAQLLRQGHRIIEVADQVGFTSSSYFAKCFRAKFGVLPKDYLASLKEQTDSAEGN